MNIKNKYCLEVWIGFAKVKANKSSSLHDVNNSYVNVLGLSNSKTMFRKKVVIALKNSGLQLKRLERIEPFNKRIQEFEIDKSLKAIAKNLLLNQLNIEFGTFHTYDE